MAFSFNFIEEKKDDTNEILDWQLSGASAVDRVRMIIDHIGADSVVLLTSFGVQSGVLLTIGASIYYAVHLTLCFATF